VDDDLGEGERDQSNRYAGGTGICPRAAEQKVDAQYSGLSDRLDKPNRLHPVLPLAAPNVDFTKTLLRCG